MALARSARFIGARAIRADGPLPTSAFDGGRLAFAARHANLANLERKRLMLSFFPSASNRRGARVPRRGVHRQLGARHAMDEARALEMSTAKVGALDVGPNEIGATEIGSTEIRTTQIFVREVLPWKIRVPEVGGTSRAHGTQQEQAAHGSSYAPARRRSPYAATSRRSGSRCFRHVDEFASQPAHRAPFRTP